MNNSRNTDDNNELPLHALKYRRVKASRGSIWLSNAFKLFKASPRAWLGISSFILLMLLFPVIKQFAMILMPIAIAGIMKGCHHLKQGSTLKFEHLFSAIKSDGKELIKLCAIYALLSIVTTIAIVLVWQLLGIDFSAMIPENFNTMTQEKMQAVVIDLINSKEFTMFLITILVAIAITIPLFMAYWFAPALIVFHKLSAINALKVSFIACKENFMPFLIYGLVAFGYIVLFISLLSIVTKIIPILGIFLIVLGNLAIFSISLASIYAGYLDIFEQVGAQQSSENNDQSTGSMLA